MKKMIKEITLDERAGEFVREDAGIICIDWKKLSELKRDMAVRGDGLRSFNPIFDNLLDYLLFRGILTLSQKDSWALKGGGFDVSPSHSAPSSPLYFTRREDAEDYTEAFYKDNKFKVSVIPARDTV